MNFTTWYKEICTELTKSGQLKQLENEFVGQKDDFGRVSVLLSKDVFFKRLIKESFNDKNNKQSELYRTTGNKLYSAASYQSALKAYTRAIKLAEPNTSYASLAYANRSAVLFALKNYKLCQIDVGLSFENGYPDELHFKLYERNGKCFFEQCFYQDAANSYKACLNSLKTANLSKKQLKEKQDSIESLISNCPFEDDQNTENLESMLYNSLYNPLTPVIDDKNSVYLSASQSFSIKSTQSQGRYAIADRDIKAGEIIIAEKPYALQCLSESFETHCYQCLTRFIVGYPCQCCSTVLYCSSECQLLSWKSSHQYECKYLQMLINDDIGLGHLAVKVILKNNLEELRNFKSIYTGRENDSGLNDQGVYDPQDYFCLYSLVGNSESRKLSDLFKRSIMAVFLCRILQNSGYLPSNSSEEDLVIVAGHLLKQIQMLPCNAHEISEAQLTGDDLASNELKEIGSAAYTTLSLLNHSCDPSVVRHCYKDVCVVRALKHISKGQEIIDNYGFLYAVEEKHERQLHLLDQYYFKCQCLPCNENWPLYSELVDDLPVFKDLNDLEVVTYFSENWQMKFQDAMESVLKGQDIAKHQEFLLNYLDLLTCKAKLPTIHVNNCQEIVKLCFSLSANFAKLK
eukprot:TCONS_00012164-protein